MYFLRIKIQKNKFTKRRRNKKLSVDYNLFLPNEIFDMSYVIESHLIKKYDADLSKIGESQNFTKSQKHLKAPLGLV